MEAAHRDLEQIVAEERAIRDRQAREYDAHRFGQRFRSVEDDVVFAQLEVRPGHVVIDGGCGTGALLPRLLSLGASVIGIDHSPESLVVAEQRVPADDRERVRLIAADVRHIPLEDGVADRALSVGVIQHIPGADNRLAAFRELRRVLKPGGIFVVSLYRWRGHIKRHKEGFFENGPYRYAFTGKELLSVLRQAGFDEIRLGGTIVLPGLLGPLGSDLQRRLAFTPAGRHLAHLLCARARAGDVGQA